MWDLPTRARTAAETPSAGVARPLAAGLRGGARHACWPATGPSRRSATVRLAKRTSNLFRTRQQTTQPGPGRHAACRACCQHRHRRADRGCRRHVHLRGPGGGHPAARPGAAGRPATQDDHRRRRRHRRRHRVDVVPQRPGLRRHRRDGRAHRRRRDRHRHRRTASTPICSTASRTPTERSGTRPGCGSGWNGSSPSSPCGTCGSPSWHDLQAAIAAIVDDPAARRRRRSTISTASSSADTESYLTLGTLTDEPGPTSDYTGQQIYYRSIQQRATDRLTIHDYLWRWDTDWFWCSRAFGAQQPMVRRLWPKRLRRSSFYWKLGRAGPSVRHRRPARTPAPPPAAGAGGPGHRGARWTGPRSSWTGSWTPIPIEPIWLCPLRLPANPRRDGRPDLAAVSDSARSRPTSTSGSGRWCRRQPGRAGRCDQPADRAEGDRAGRAQVAVLRCVTTPRRISPTSTAGVTYAMLKTRYDPDSRLLNLYDKAVRRQ